MQSIRCIFVRVGTNPFVLILRGDTRLGPSNVLAKPVVVISVHTVLTIAAPLLRVLIIFG